MKERRHACSCRRKKDTTTNTSRSTPEQTGSGDLADLRQVWQHPTGTTHTCPRRSKPVKTYADPALNAPSSKSGAWLRCFGCGWNGARDYAAAINIALLGVAFFRQDHATNHPVHPTMTQKPAP